MTTLKLNPLHIQMLEAGTFHIDGWNSDRGKIAAHELHAAGYTVCFDSGSDYQQSTCLNYTITEQGREALAKAEGSA